MGHLIGNQISLRQSPLVIDHILPDLSEIGAIPPLNALEILRETVRILRADPSTFMSILALLICPVSSAFLSNFLLNQSFVSGVGHRLMLLAVTSGLPPARLLKQMCHHLAGTLVSSLCRKEGCDNRVQRDDWPHSEAPGLDLHLQLCCNLCNVAGVISVLEDASGPRALLRSMRLVKRQIQAGLVIFFGTTTGLAFVEGLFEHRVKTLSYGDGSSRIWEGPLLVLMYSFVVLIDSMMSAVFYFTCRSSSMEPLNANELTSEELENLSSEKDHVPCIQTPDISYKIAER